MTSALQPTPAPSIELELAKLANDAMANGADPHDVTAKLHQTIRYLRQFPKMAEHATNALADGVASPADISRTLWPHVQAISHASGSNVPSAAEAASLPADPSARARFGGGLASFVSGIPGGEALTTGAHALLNREPWTESLRDVRAAEDASPIHTPLEMAGAGLSLATQPGTNMAKGAIYGGLRGFTDPEPEADRREEVIQNAATGGLLGAGADVLGAIGGKIGGKLRLQGAKESQAATALKDQLGAAFRRVRGTPTAAATPSAPANPMALRGLVGNTPPEVTPGTLTHSVDDMMSSLLRQLRAEQPQEIGNTIGDAELAMHPPTPPINLEDLLRRSIAAKGGTPAIP